MNAKNYQAVSTLGAVDLIREDHRTIMRLFDFFERTEDRAEQRRIAWEALHELTVHTSLEERVFYPAVRKALRDDSLLEEAAEEHHILKLLIGELERMRPSAPHFDAKFCVLSQNARHHFREEEEKILPRVIEARLDLAALGEQMGALRERLSRSGLRRQRTGKRNLHARDRRGRLRAL